MFEEHETEDAEEVVQEGDCCGDEITLSQDAETMGDALQFQNHGDASLPETDANSMDLKSVSMDLDKVETLAFADTDGISEEKTNSVSYGGGSAQVCQDPGARIPIGASGIENFGFQNYELIQKSLKAETCKTVQCQVQTKCSSQRKSWDKKIHQHDFLKPEVSDLAKMGESQSVLSNEEVVVES